MIDFVVTWLDSNDPVWQEQFMQYKGCFKSGDRSKARFRDWDLFRYWFRSVECYAPWVHKVYLVTNGKFPDWINKDCDKLVLVKHSDYIPQKYLPTFNSITIELNFDKIEGLSEQFVYFNDDCYLNAPISPEYFFQKGLPCDNTEENLLTAARYTKERSFDIDLHRTCDVGLLNGNFNRKEVVKHAPGKWFNLKLSLYGMFVSVFLTLIRRSKFEGFRGAHVEQPMLKTIISEIWEKEPKMMDISCSRFREDFSLNPYIIRYWQLAKNLFKPKKFKAKVDILSHANLESIKAHLYNKKIKSLCLNDDYPMTEDEFNRLNQEMVALMQDKFPHKSCFEL